MRKLVVAEHISLDGVIQAPGGPDEDPSNGFAFGGWSAPFESEEVGAAVMELHAQPFELLLGRLTYDIWAAYWPNQKVGNPIADAFNGTVKHVATRRPESLGWQESRPLPSSDVVEGVKELKTSEGPHLLLWGSGEVAREALKAGLVDVLWLFVYPVVLGGGKKLFDARAMPSSFSVARAANSSTGVQVLKLERAGDVRTGSYT